MFCKKVFSKILQNSQSSATFLKKRLWHRCFPVNFAKFFRTTFFIEHLWWLLLSSLFFNSLIRTCFFENLNCNTQFFLEMCLRNVCKLYLKYFDRTLSKYVEIHISRCISRTTCCVTKNKLSVYP